MLYLCFEDHSNNYIEQRITSEEWKEYVNKMNGYLISGNNKNVLLCDKVHNASVVGSIANSFDKLSD